MKNKVDIIVPVYNAFESLEKCIKSVIKNTDLINNNLIIIDDGSTDERIFDFYNKIDKNKDKNIKIYKNKENLGFVGTVNRGMGLNKKNDVLLLNSDTVVTNNWLNNILECAYSSSIIATVTPLSNNATICSVPNFVQDNQLPDGFDIDSFADLISSKSLKLYPQLPTGHGFCFFIKREILDIFGFFNLELFGKGYGEENEFCLRVEKYGYKNVLDDTTFIHHSGSASFTDEARINKVNNNIKIIENLYPGYQLRIENFVRTNPLKPIHNNINFWIKNKNLFFKNKKRILFVMHYEPSVGGIGINAFNIAKYLNKDFDFLCFHRNKDGGLSLDYFNNEKWENIFELSLDSCYSKLVDNEIEKVFESLIMEFEIDLVHFHHLMGLPLSLINIPKKLNIISFLSLHDYYLISESPTFKGDHLFKTINFSSNGKEDGKKVNNILKKCDCYKFIFFKKSVFSFQEIITPSLYVKNLYSELLPKTIPLKTIEHGVELKKRIGGISNLNDDVVNIAFLGVAVGHKGIDVFINLLEDKKFKNKKINWYIIGEIDKSVEFKLNELKNKNNLSILGKYNISNLDKILVENKISLILLLSNVPETFSYTLTEAVQMNIPVISNDIGALGSRVVDGGFGWIYKTYEDLVNIISDLIKNKKKIFKKSLELTGNNKNISVRDMALNYGFEYNSFLKNKLSFKKTNYLNKENILLKKIFLMEDIQNFQKDIYMKNIVNFENKKLIQIKSILKRNKLFGNF